VVKDKRLTVKMKLLPVLIGMLVLAYCDALSTSLERMEISSAEDSHCPGRKEICMASCSCESISVCLMINIVRSNVQDSPCGHYKAEKHMHDGENSIRQMRSVESDEDSGSDASDFGSESEDTTEDVNLDGVCSTCAVSCGFTLNEDYSTVVGNDPDPFCEHVLNQTAIAIDIDYDQMYDCELSEGSIIVSFQIVGSNNGYSTAEAVQILADLVESGSLSVTDLSGSVMDLDTSSFTYEALGSDGNSYTIIAVSITVAIILCITLGAVVIWLKHRAQSKKVAAVSTPDEASTGTKYANHPEKVAVVFSSDEASTGTKYANHPEKVAVVFSSDEENTGTMYPSTYDENSKAAVPPNDLLYGDEGIQN